MAGSKEEETRDEEPREVPQKRDVTQILETFTDDQLGRRESELRERGIGTGTVEPHENRIATLEKVREHIAATLHTITSVVQYMKFANVTDIEGRNGVWEIALRRTAQIGSEINSAVPKSVAGETTLPSYSRTELIFRKKQPKLPPAQTIAKFGS